VLQTESRQSGPIEIKEGIEVALMRTHLKLLYRGESQWRHADSAAESKVRSGSRLVQGQSSWKSRPSGDRRSA